MTPQGKLRRVLRRSPWRVYQAQLESWWMLQPDLQYVINPGGGVLNADDSLRRTAWVIGVRSSLTF
jgi:porin